MKCDVELCFFLVCAGAGGTGQVFARRIVDIDLEDSRDARLPAVHVHVGAEEFSVFVEKENDSTPFGVIYHHVELALPFFHGRERFGLESDAQAALATK